MSSRLASLFATAFLTAVPVLAFAQQTVVLPQTAGQNQVRWDKFDWEYVDLLTTKDKSEGAGLRLYYYKGEKDAAERAAAAVEEEYRWLSEQFDYKPTIKIPYILYNSHGELEQTNIFQIGESTLGVTSPEDLRMTTAYWGDHSRFRHVSLHEMVHQFTIQKVNSVAEKARAYGSPLQKMPLWFIEGLAEYYSTPGGMDSEAEEYLRDLVANPDPYRGYALPAFLSDEQRSFIFTYKLGQGRCYFLAETYGKQKLQDILATSYRMRGWRRTLGTGAGGVDNKANNPPSMRRDRVLEFDELLERVTGDPPDKMQAKWEDWLKRRYYKQYLAATQKFSDFKEVEAARRYPDAFVVSPDGNAMIYRGIEPVTGKTHLWLIDPRDPFSQSELVEDGRPGVDTLHYFDRPVAAISEDRIVYVARKGRGDVLRILNYKHSSRDAEDGNRIRTRAHFRIGGGRRTYDPASAKIRELGSPVFSPDRTKLAVVGLDASGITDVWTLELKSGKWTRLTNDSYAEKEIDWGPAGIVVSSDATETRTYNLFLLDPETGIQRRITHASANHRYPRFTPEGDTIGYSGDDAHKWDIYLLQVAAAIGSGVVAPPEPPKSEGREPATSEVEGTKSSMLSYDSSTLVAQAGVTDAPRSTPVPKPTVAPISTPGAVPSTDVTASGASAAGAQPLPTPAGPLVRATDFPTGLVYPMFTKTRTFAVGLKGGRFRVFAIDRASLANEAVPYEPGGAYTPWAIPTRELDHPREYSIWRGDSWQLEQAFATLGGSTGIYGGGFLLFNDRMRDRTVYITANAFGRADLTAAQAVYLDRTHRAGLGVAAFLTPQPVVDPIYSSNQRTILFLEQKFGAAGIVEYPFNRFFRLGGSLGLAGTRRFIPSFFNLPEFGYGFGSDITGRKSWEHQNAGVAPEIDGSLSLGFDTLTQSWETGPLDGNSLIATVSSFYQPTHNSWFGQYQVDGEHYIRLYKTVNLGIRAAWGESFGDEWKRPFYVSSTDNLRGVPYFQYQYLIANKYAVGNAELQVPLDGLIRLLIFQNIEGIAAVDAGSVFNHYGDFSNNRTAAFVTGFNFNLAIFQFRLHFARPFDIGGLKPGVARPQDGQVIVPDGWVTNFTIRYLFF